MPVKKSTKAPKKTVKPAKAAPKGAKSGVKKASKPAPKSAKPKTAHKSAVKAPARKTAIAKSAKPAKAVPVKPTGFKIAIPVRGGPGSTLKPVPRSGKAPDYKVGDVLFYPRQGLCKFEMIVHEMSMEFFLLKPMNGPGHATIRVPMMNAEKVGLRRPSATMTFEAACAVLKKLPSEFESDWRKRNQMLTDQTMRGLTTDLLAAAKILAIQDSVKPLSHQERRQYEQIVQFAADEIALIEQGSGATVALNLMDYMRQLTNKNRAASSFSGGGR